VEYNERYDVFNYKICKQENKMPQLDRHKNRMVPIEFQPVENFDALPYADRCTIILITAGSVKGILNGQPLNLFAPGILCLSYMDKINVSENNHASAQSFSFHTDFLNSVRASEAQEKVSAKLRMQTGLALFNRQDCSLGVFSIPDNVYSQIREWFFILGAETLAQSDILWVCRIKKYLIQIFGMLENLGRQLEQSPVSLALAYIYTNYFNKITLQDITRHAHLNRVSLNEMFKKQFGCTAMGYLTLHRLQIAGDMLIHTDMCLNEIARSTGFEYDTYFIKQFTAKRGISPTAYRTESRKHAEFV
jgi:AraC-like DNA-binding protein